MNWKPVRDAYLRHPQFRSLIKRSVEFGWIQMGSDGFRRIYMDSVEFGWIQMGSDGLR